MQSPTSLSGSDLLLLLDVINQCSLATSRSEEINLALESFRQIVPFECALIVLNQSDDQRFQSNNLIHHYRWDEEWIQMYESHNLWRDDPLVLMSRLMAYPIFWSACADEMKNTNNRAYQLLQRRSITEGICTNRRYCDAYSSSCFISLGFSSRALPTERHRLFLNYASTHIQQIFLRQGERNLARHNAPVLTKRELETLLWILQGKNTSDISMILSISERTVKFHIANVFEKLNVVNRPQAIAKAISLGLLAPNT